MCFLHPERARLQLSSHGLLFFFFFCFFFGGLGGWGLFTVMLIVNAVNNN